MKFKRHLLSSATALVAIAALAGTASAQTDQQADDALQDQQAAVGECEMAFQDIDEARIDDALAQDMQLMRDSALRLEEYGRTDLCIEIAEAIREIADDPERAAAADEPTDPEDLAEAEPETLEPADEGVVEAPAEPAEEEADVADAPTDQENLAEAEPEALEPADEDVAEAPAEEEADVAEAPTDPAELDEPETTGQTDAAELDADAEDTEVTELDEPAATGDEAAELDEPLDDTETAEVDEEVDEQVTEAERPTETFLSMQEEDDLLAGELMGANVENTEGETLGSISDVVIHDDIGVKAVVIGVGGFLGIGQKKVAVNFQEIEHRRDEYGDVTLVFAATRDQLDEAPEFQTLQDQIAEAETQQMDMQMEQPLAPAD